MIDYPAGQQPPIRSGNRFDWAKNKSQPQQVVYGSRGMSLEEQLNQANTYYNQHKIAVIHKKPTPIQVVKVDYPKRSAARITEAYYRHASTTDYNGVYLGRYIDFEAKETKNKTSFPLQNLPKHQLDHMAACHEQGGIVFIIISFKVHQEVYLLPFSKIQTFLTKHTNHSIPYNYIKEHGYICQQGYQPPIDYLKALDDYLQTQP